MTKQTNSKDNANNKNKTTETTLPRRVWTMLFGPQVEFRAKLFNVVMVLCGPGSFVAAANNYTNGSVVDMVTMTIVGILCLSMLWYVTKTGKYNACYVITVIAIYLVAVVMYYTMGGYECRAADYVFYVAFTSVFLRGKLRIFFCLLWIATGVTNVYIELNYPHLGWVQYLDRDVIFNEVAIGGIVVLSGTIAAILIWFFNIYDRQVEELETARDKVEELQKMQSDLFKRMSHEMRTPLSAMSIYAQLAVKELEHGTVSTNTLTDLTTVSGEAERLSDMADSVLKILTSSFSRDQLDTEQLEPEPLDAGELAVKVANIARHALVKDGRSLEVDIAENAGLIIGDSGAIMQLFWNILTNAIAHSGANNIIVRLSDSDDGKYLKVTVEDDGKGIPPDLLPRIFDEGVSGAGSSGLGLPLCKRIAKWHGGDITVESELGKGTRFTILLSRDRDEA